MKWSLLLLSFLTFACMQKNENVENQTTEKGHLMHIVFFDLKDSLSLEEKKTFLTQLEVLKNIDNVTGLSIGAFKDLGDERALSDYDVAMQMSFKDSSEYQVYQTHPVHLELKKQLGKYLGNRPAVYDYIIN